MSFQALTATSAVQEEKRPIIPPGSVLVATDENEIGPAEDKTRPDSDPVLASIAE